MTILAIEGIAPGQGKTSYLDISDRNRELYRTWCREQGCPSSWTLTAKDYQLSAAYREPAYLAKIQALGTKLGAKRNRGYVPTVNLDELGDEALAESRLTTTEERPTGFGKTLSSEGLAKLQSPNLFVEPSPRPTPNGSDGGSSSDPKFETTLAAIAKAADQVITTRLGTLEASLRQQIKTEVTTAARVEMERVGLSDRVKQKIRDLARDGAHSYVEEMLPRALNITVNNQPLTSIAAEPRHSIFDECLQWFATGENVYLVGPAGTGKTHLGKQLSTALTLRFLPVPQALTKYEFSGFVDGGGTYRGTIVRDAIENGGLLMVDEIDSFAAAAIMFLNSVLANGYCPFPDGQLIAAHPDFKVLAAANTYGRGATHEYVGRNPLDAASLDRFTYIPCDYDEKMEKQLYGDTNGWTTYVQSVRAAVREFRIQHIISMRAIVRFHRGMAAGLDPDVVCHRALWRGLEPDQISRITSRVGRPSTSVKAQPSPMVDGVSEKSVAKIAYDEFLQAIANGETIKAIKIYRETNAHRDIGLKLAKDYVENLIEGLDDPSFDSFIGQHSPAAANSPLEFAQ